MIKLGGDFEIPPAAFNSEILILGACGAKILVSNSKLSSLLIWYMYEYTCIRFA